MFAALRGAFLSCLFSFEIFSYLAQMTLLADLESDMLNPHDAAAQCAHTFVFAFF